MLLKGEVATDNTPGPKAGLGRLMGIGALLSARRQLELPTDDN
jgi:hypothetical protein